MYLGIDLGTSNSAIVGHMGDNLRLFKTSDNKDVLPSAVYLDPRGHRFVGSRAYEQAAISPENVAREFKRLMGTSTPLKFARAGISLTPEEASAEVLRTLLSQATSESGVEDIKGTIVTVPAAFNQMQTEATIAAADLAGLGSVGLLQEPIAAAMASMATSTARNGQFLVYDLGGGTFDVALVQSSGGTVNVIAHEGVNMLGGKDFDELLMRQMVHPWLESNFALPQDYQLLPEYQKLFKRIKLQAEKAKVELSTLESTTLFLADDDIRINDSAGREIYIDIQFDRNSLEKFINPSIDRTVSLCQKIIAANGFVPGDIDRIVLIGGPSKIPLIRRRLPEELGVPADLATDPMTAVATGAAIYAESREWGGRQTYRKSSRASQSAGDTMGVKYEYPARSADDKITLRVSTAEVEDGWRLRIQGADGWSSGDVELQSKLRIELPLSKVGINEFKGTLYLNGRPIETTELVVTRSFASAASVPASLTVCVAIEQIKAAGIIETLHPLVKKGTPLPASGTGRYKAARALVGGNPGYIDIKLFQAPEGIDDPSLALFIGSYRLDAERDLPLGDVLRQGEDIVIDWAMDDNGLLSGNITLPQHSMIFDMGKYYSPKIGHKDFGGTEGAELAAGLVAEAARSVQDVEELLGQTSWQDLQKLKSRIELQTAALAASEDPDARRQAADEALAVRQDVARLRAAPENVSLVVGRELVACEELYEEISDGITDDSIRTRIDQLFVSARKFFDQKRWDEAKSCITQLNGAINSELIKRTDFNVLYFERLTRERYLAIDKDIFDRLINTGIKAIQDEDWETLRRTNASLTGNQIKSAGIDSLKVQMGGLTRA